MPSPRQPGDSFGEHRWSGIDTSCTVGRGMPEMTKGSELRSGFIASPARFSMAVIILIVAFFLSATAYTQHETAKLDELAALISLNAGPAIEDLTQARGEIGTIERQIHAAGAAAMQGHPFDRTTLDAAERRLHAEIKT